MKVCRYIFYLPNDYVFHFMARNTNVFPALAKKAKYLREISTTRSI